MPPAGVSLLPHSAPRKRRILAVQTEQLLFCSGSVEENFVLAIAAAVL
jgi:hypothetical protein